jgi:hypothetical protein
MNVVDAIETKWMKFGDMGQKYHELQKAWSCEWN